MTPCQPGVISRDETMSTRGHFKLLGIKFAPLNIPVKRRLETFAVLQWTLSFFFMGLSCVGLLLGLLFTRFYWLTLGYFVWYIYDYSKPERGGRRVDWVRRWSLWKHYRDFFPISLIKTSDLDPGKNYIFGYHPHGIMGDGAFGNFATEATGFSGLFPGIRPMLLTLKLQFVFPITREYLMAVGSCTCSRASMEWLLSKEGTGNALVLVVGGATEALNAWPGSFNLRLKNRKGFIRLALKHGASLVPVFSFGENDVFSQKRFPEGSLLHRLQIKGKQLLGFSAPFFHGRGIFNYTFGFLPYRCPINTVVGSPMDVKQVMEPTVGQVDELHAAYIRQLQELFEMHKLKYGVPEDQHLSIL